MPSDSPKIVRHFGQVRPSKAAAIALIALLTFALLPSTGYAAATGDVNGDGVINPADVFYLINFLFASGAAPIGSGDVNGDGQVNVVDVFYLINYLFAGGPPPVGCGEIITVTNPATATGTAGSAFGQTFTQSGAIGGATFSLASGTPPTGLTLAADGTLSGAPTQTGSFPITVRVTDGNGCIGVGPTYTLTIACQTITVTNPATNAGTPNTPFSQTFTQSGAIGGATFTLASGTLPTGLTLAANGTLSGTPTQTGTFPITVRATDANGCSGLGATYNLSIGCQAIAVTNPGTAGGTVNAAFSQIFTQTGAVGGATFTLASGTLPAGMALAANGTLSGTPTQNGTFPITVRATDANGCSGLGATYNLSIACQVITVTNPGVNTGTVNAPFSQTFTQTGGFGATTFSTVSALPTGLSLNSSGLLSGTPLQPGLFTITVTATDSNGCTGSSNYTLTISCQTITVTNPANATGAAGAALSETFTQTGGLGTTNFTTSSTLPTGLTLAANGTLSGTPLQGGTFPIVVVATDTNGCTGTGATYNLTITCPTITVTNPATASGTAGTAFSQNFTQSGGAGTATFTLASGTLPTGLTLAANGTLSGTPNQVGTFPITVRATDQNGCIGVGPTYNLSITCPTITVTNPVVTTGTAGTAFSQTFTQNGGFGTVNFTTSSTLPTGLTLASNGTLSGTPTQTGAFLIVVTATDSSGCTGNSPSYNLTIGCPTISVTNPGVTTGTVDAPFSQTFTQTGAVNGATFSIDTGVLPAGLTLAANGTLSGAPTVTGSFPITVKVTDGNGCTGTGGTYTLVIGCQTITVTKPATTTGTVGQPFSQQFTQSGAHGTATFTTGSTLPTGFTLSTAGLLSGTTNQHTSFPIVVTVTDSNGCTGTSATYNLVISCQTITVTNPVNTSATVGSPFSEQFTQSGAIAGATFTTASTLPNGLTLSTGGLLSGTPTQGGPFNIVVTVTDGNGCIGTSANYHLVVACPTITVNNPGVNTGTAGVAFSQQFTNTGGSGTITWSETGSLPSSFVFNTTNGTLSGTTTQAGVFPLTITATDQNGCTGSSPYTLTINCQTITVTNPVTNSVNSGSALDVVFTVSGILGTVTWSETGALPSGITLNPTTGHLAGTSTQSGTYPITVRATDTNGCFDDSAYTLTVTCPSITVARTGGGSFPAGTFNTAYAGQSVMASGGTAPYSFAVTSGALPGSVSLATNGTLSGTPSTTGTFSFTVTATDSNNCTGSQAFSIAIAPVAGNDSYSNLVNNTEAVVTGGTTVSPATPFVPLSGAIIANDAPLGGVTATAGTFATTQAGSVTIAADGTFKYTPPVTASPLASDTFTYTISSNTGGGAATQATATVTLNLAGRVWYVKNNGSNGNGQSQSPFNSTSNFSNGARVSPDTTGDIIFIFTGDTTTTNQTSGVALLANEQLIGQGVALVVNTVTLVTASTKPQITNSTANSDAVTLHDGNTIKGLNITGATRDGIAGSTHAGFTGDTLTIQNNSNSGLHLTSMTGTVTVTNTTFSGNAVGLDVNNGTATITVNNTNTITANNGQRSASIQNRPVAAGNITIGAAITDGAVGTTGISVSNNLSGTIAFTGTQTLTTGSNTAVSLTTNAGTTITFSGTLNITSTTGSGFVASGGGTLNVTGTATILTGAATAGLSLNGMTVGGSGVAFNTVSTTGATIGISLTNMTGTVAVNGGTITNGTTGISLQGATTNLTLAGLTISGPTTAITNTTNFGTLTIGASVNVSGATALNLTTGAVTGTFANVSSTGGTNGVNLNAVTGTWGASAGTLTGASGSTFNVTGGSGGTITWAGTINQPNAANVVTIAGSNSNTINFNGNVTTSGTSTGINISGSSGTYNFNGGANTINGTGATGITISNESGTISFGSGTSINGPTTSFKIGGSATNVSANITYSGTITNNVNAGVVLDINSASGTFNGTLNMNGTSLTGNGSLASGVVSVIKNMTGTLTVNHLSLTSSNIAFNNTLLAISGTNTAGNFTFNNLTLSATGANHTGKGLTMSGGGTLTITATGGASSIDVGSTALDLNGIALGGSTVATVNSAGGGANGIILTSVTGGTFTVSSGTLTGSSTGAPFLVSGGSATFTYNGSMSQSNGQRVVNISGITGGTITLGGTITGSNTSTGITLGGSGGTVTISGGITLDGAGDTFSATTSGLTVNVTGTNTIGATTPPTGPAVNIANATIGASGVTFRSISATGGTNGIVLNTTGSTGTFTVAGNAGTCTSLASTCTGGTIQNTTGHAISLNSTQTPAFNFIKITNIGTSGIFGTNVTNFTLANSVIDGVNTSHTGADANVAFNTGVSGTENNVSGAVSITNNHLNNSYQAGIDIQNYSGTISSLTITGNTLTSNTSNTLSLGTAINVVANRGGGNHASITAGTISSNTIQNFPGGAGIQVIGGNSNSGQAVTVASVGSPFIINSNTITGAGLAGAGIGTNGIAVTAGESTTAYFSIGANGAANNITNVRGDGIDCSLFGNGTEKCIIQFNVINANNTAGSSGINTGADQSVASGSAGVGTLYLDIHNNSVTNTTGVGILATVSSVSTTGIYWIQNNTVAAPTTVSPSIYGIRVSSGNGVGNPTVCLKISGNVTAGSTNGATTAPGIGLRQSHVDPGGGIGTFNIDGLTPNPSNDAQMEAYVGNTGQNPGSANGSFGATGVASISAGGTFHTSTCSIP